MPECSVPWQTQVVAILNWLLNSLSEVWNKTHLEASGCVFFVHLPRARGRLALATDTVTRNESCPRAEAECALGKRALLFCRVIGSEIQM